jgi:G3E family GTPase
MSGTPFDKATSSIPVTIVTSDAVAEQPEDVALIRLEPALHEHPPGGECVACAARGDVRAMLFDLLASARAGGRKPFNRVVIDASRLRDPQPIIDRLDPHSPAIGLRDHTVAKSFHLTRVI